MNDYTKTSSVACPVCAINDCPYCDKEGMCHLRTRKTDCDDYATVAED